MPQINFYVCGSEGCCCPLPGFSHTEWEHRYVSSLEVQSKPRLCWTSLHLAKSQLLYVCVCSRIKGKSTRSLFCYHVFIWQARSTGGLLFAVPASHQSLPVPAKLQLTTLWAGWASVTCENIYDTATWEGSLTFTKTFLLKKVAPAIICLTF